MEELELRNKKYNFIVLIASLILALILAEGILRIFYPAHYEVLADDQLLLYKMLPGGQIDKNGFRNDKVLDSYDIVAIGDSQTYGNSVSLTGQAWPQQLSQILGQKVYNMAVAGYGPLQYYYLTKTALNFKPKLVIWGLYLGNDLYDAYDVAYNQDKTGYWQSFVNAETKKSIDAENLPTIPYEAVLPQSMSDKLTANASIVLKIRMFLRDHVRLYAFLGDVSRSLREKLGFAKPHEKVVVDDAQQWARTHPDLGLVYNQAGQDTVLTTVYRNNVLNLKDPRIAAGLEDSKQAILKAKTELESQGTKFLVVIIPTKESVYQEAALKAKVTSETYSQLLLNEASVRGNLDDFCQSNQLDCFSLLSPLKQALASSGERLYPRTHDGHPLEAGNKVMAQAIVDYLNNHK